MTQVEFQRYQEQTFDSYVKRLIRNEGRNAKKELARRAEREVNLSMISPPLKQPAEKSQKKRASN